MADSSPKRGFGQVDLDLESDHDMQSSAGFGELDWDLPEEPDAPPPASSARNVGVASAHTETTRIVKGDALSHLSRSSPPPPLEESRGPIGGNATRMGSLDEGLLAMARGDSNPPPSVPSKSGVATRADVAQLRDLYAKGDAAGALMLASSIAPPVMAEKSAADHPDASIVVEFGEELEIDVSLTGLEPPGASSEAPPAAATAPLDEIPIDVVPAYSTPPAAGLSLSQRQSVPRLVKTPAEIATLPIDHRAGFLLGFVDGMQTLEEILDVCAMPGPEALQLIEQLTSLGVIVFE
jgi:hypothetical protein